MKRLKVSVIIPTYNRAHYLGTAVRSVLNQNFNDFELIIVDDGSDDDTQHLVQSFRDGRLRYIYREHRGISAAMNAGLRAARGDYIARLDSDDVWLPDMLGVEVEVLDARPEIGLVYAKAQAMDKDCNLLPDTRGAPGHYPGGSFRSMLVMDFTCNITIVVRRSCFGSVGLYDESLNVNEDWDMWLRVSVHYRFAFVDRVVARFRYHDGNTTGTHSPFFLEHLSGRRRALDKIFNQPKLPSDILTMKPVAYRNLYLWVGRCWLELQEYKRALHSFWCAVRVGGNPPLTLAEIVWVVLVTKFFWRYTWGRRFAEGMAILRRRFREMRTSHHERLVK
jgi:Glycosyltransferases involved in cell wall biogenesis